MHIVLLLLKWIGILLAVLIGLLLVALAAGLLIPVRYRLKVDTSDETRIWARAGWLFRLVCIQGSYLDGELSYRLKVFGIPIKAEGGEEKPSRKKKKRKRASPKKASPEKKAKVIPEDKRISPPQMPGPLERQESESREQAGGLEEKKPERLGPFEKLKNRISALWEKAARFIRDLKDKIRGIWQTIRRLIHMGKRLLSFFMEEGNKPGFLLVFSSLKRLLKHLGPTKIKGSVIFGTGDPCSTGQLLGVAGLFYGWYGKTVTITPDFEEQVFQARLIAKGRIRAGTLLIIIGKLFFNKDFQNVLEQWKQVKEEL